MSICTSFLFSGEPVYRGGQHGKALVVERVMHPFPLPVPFDEPRVAERFHVVRKSRLRYFEAFQQLAGAQLPAGEHLHDHQPIGVGKSLEHLGEFCVIYHV